MADADPFAQYVAPSPAGADPFAQYVAPAAPAAHPAIAARISALGGPGASDPDGPAPPILGNVPGRGVGGYPGRGGHVTDPMEADPIAQGVVGGVLGAGAGALAGGVVPAIAAPVVSGAVDGATQTAVQGGSPGEIAGGALLGGAFEGATQARGVANRIGEGARDRQIARAKEALEMQVNKRTRGGMRTDVVDSAIADNPKLRSAAGNDAKVAQVTAAMKQGGGADLAKIYAKSGPADEAVAKSVGNVDDRIAGLKSSDDVNDRAAAAKLQKLRDEFNDSYGGRETTSADQLRAAQSSYQRNGYAKNISGDPEVSATILANREMSKAVGDAVVQHVTGMDYATAKAAAEADPNGVAAQLFKANGKIDAANKIEAGIADRAGRMKPKEGLLRIAQEIKHSPSGYVLSKGPQALSAVGRGADAALSKLGGDRPAIRAPAPLISEAAPYGGDISRLGAQQPQNGPVSSAQNAAGIASLIQAARAGATRAQLHAQAQQDGVPVEIADNLAQQRGL